MRDVVFETPMPVESVSPQWIRFIHEVNRLAVEAGQGKPFGTSRANVERNHARGDLADIVLDIDIEIYEEALIIHTEKYDFDQKIGVTRFRPTTPRVRKLFSEAAKAFSEANVTTPEYLDIGGYYTRQRALIEALEIQLEDAYDNAGDPETIACIERQLEKARVID